MSTLSRATGTTRKRNPRDYYPTIDPRAVAPLVAHLGPVNYIEPCAGAGHLIRLLLPHGLIAAEAYDIEPQMAGIQRRDALTLEPQHSCRPLPYITNPPWDRRILHALIEHLARLGPTWLLFDAAWKETKQASRFGAWCHTIISVGRLQWIEGSNAQSTDDCSWYGFDARHDGGTRYIWPTANRDPVEQFNLL